MPLRRYLPACVARLMVSRAGWLSLALGLLIFGAHAADTPLSFPDAQQQTRYERLLSELRCLVCQNQSLADSHADLAQDLRNEVFRLIGSGQTDREILAFLVSRYGDFVLYKPPVKGTTWLLWFGPFALLVIIGGVWWRVAGNAPSTPTEALSSDEEARLKALADTELTRGTPP